MEEWVFLGESGSDAETVCSVDDKGSETDFAMVQLRRSRAAESRATMAEGGKNQDEEESDEDGDDYFDLNLPALAGSKAVFGANGDCFDLDLAASILSMGSVGYGSGFHGADAEDDIDTVSLGAPDGDGDGDGTVHPERVLCAHCAKIDTDQSSDAAKLVKYDDIDTGSSDDELPDEDDTDQSSGMAGLVKYDDIHIDTGSSDSSETDYGDNDELSDEDDTDGSVWAELVNYDDIDTGSSDSSESDHDGNDELSDEDNTDGNVAPQQRRLTAIATRRPPSAPHLFFTQPTRSTYKSTNAEESDDNYETESYSAKGDKDDDHTKTSYTSLAHRDEVISGFVGAMMTRADALARFDAVESALELPQYSLSRSDVHAWKAALGKGRAEIAARPRPPVAPHLFFTQPSRST